MGHAHHFLSRLDRVSLPHAELALGLYNDVPLLQYILRAANVPERVERVAISLHDPTRGPFIVVTREGRFVTCLGEGMTVHDLPVITRAQLDAMAGRAGALRTKLEESAPRVGRDGAVHKMLRRIQEAADELSREEMHALAGLAPLYAFELYRFLMGASVDIAEARKAYADVLKRTDRPGPRYRDALRAFHCSYHAIGHYAVLIGVNGAATLERIPAELRERAVNVSLSWGAVRQGHIMLAVRGLWAVAQIGEPLVAPTLARLEEAHSPLTYLDSAAGLAVIGARHPHLQSEIREALTARPPVPVNPKIGALLQSMHSLIMEIFYGGPETADLVDVGLAAFGAGLWMGATEDLPRSSPFRFAQLEDVPVDLARTAAVNAEMDFLKNGKRLSDLLSALPWAVNAPAEALYLRKAALDAIHTPWKPEHTLATLLAHRDYYKVPQRRPEGPARKGPCPCGSGKKYKRCCEPEEEGVEAEGA